jgi:hypothetical protein
MKRFVLAALFAATAAQAQPLEQVWAVNTPKDADAILAFGTPGGADAPVAFRCTPKSGQVRVVALLTRSPPPEDPTIPASVTIASETTSSTLRGQVTRALGGGGLASTEFSTEAPLVDAFRKSGLVSVTALGETVTLPPAPKSTVRKFFGACR